MIRGSGTYITRKRITKFQTGFYGDRKQTLSRPSTRIRISIRNADTCIFEKKKRKKIKLLRVGRKDHVRAFLVLPLLGQMSNLSVLEACIVYYYGPHNCRWPDRVACDFQARIYNPTL